MRYKVKNPRVRIDAHTGCWHWLGSINRSKGYGLKHCGRRGKSTTAHRWMYEHMLGIVVPDDKQVDHLCGVRDCVNPAHLEMVAPTENNRRARRIPIEQWAAATYARGLSA